MKDAANKSFLNKFGLLLAKDLRKSLKILANEDKIGGALVLGLNHVIVKAHGGSKQMMLVNSLDTAKKLVEADITDNFKKII